MVAREVRFWMKEKVKEGVPIARVAREYGVSRQTIYNLPAAAASPAKERKARGSKLDPFKRHIVARLANFDLPATVLFDEVRQRGYAGRLTTVKDFVREVKAEAVREVIARFETDPGVQAQVDWGECGTGSDPTSVDAKGLASAACACPQNRASMTVSTCFERSALVLPGLWCHKCASFVGTGGAMSTQERVRTKVYRLARGKPLPLATFQSCGTPTSVRQAVSRLTKSGELVRVAQGVYARPKPVRFLKNSALPTPEAVAKVIAKQNHEELAPHGADVARGLGLSTQMTMQSAFYTTGRTRKVPLQRGAVAFEHAPRYLIAQQHTPEGKALLALNYLGPRHITEEVLQRLRERIPSESFARLDKRKLPHWLRRTITAIEASPRA